MAGRARERELKFTPGTDFRGPEAIERLPGLRAGAPAVRTLHATYYDTDDLRLARAGASLRWRDDQGWVVKLPVTTGALLTRDELPVAGEHGDVPGEALDLVLALVRRAPLHEVARLVTVRTRLDLFDRADDPVAELVDDEVSVLDGSHLVARFREIEVELTPQAAPDLADEIVAAMRAAGAGPPDPVPKIVRALGARAAAPGELDDPGDLEHLDEASMPRDVLRAALLRSTRRLVAHDPGVRRGDDPEAVHQARVATRRMRSDLRTFSRVVDHDWAAALRDELQWLGGLLGAVRDTDVLLERLERRLVTLDPADTAAGGHLLTALHEQRDAARHTLVAALRGDRYLALLDRLHGAAQRVPGPVDAGDLGIETVDLVRAPWRRLCRAADRLDDGSPDEELHRVRILAKRCRYAAEAVAPACGPEAARFARKVAALQDVLGEHQDAVIAGRWLRARATGTGGGTDAGIDTAAAFVAGELAMLELAAADASRESWPAAWREARTRRLRRWMRRTS